MRWEMTMYLGVDPDAVDEVGSPQFEIYASEMPATRADAAAHFGFVPGTRMMLYGSSAPRHLPWEAVYVETLAESVAELMRDGLGPLGLIVRPHPRDHAHRYGALDRFDLVHVELAGHQGDGVADRWSPTDDEARSTTGATSTPTPILTIGLIIRRPHARQTAAHGLDAVLPFLHAGSSG
jgi:hypothetical protein